MLLCSGSIRCLAGATLVLNFFNCKGNVMSDSNSAQWTYMCDQLLGVQFSQMYMIKLAESMTGPVISETVYKAVAAGSRGV